MTPAAELRRFTPTRRDGLAIAGAGALGLVAGATRETIISAQTGQKPQEKLLGEMFGMGDSTLVGGSQDIDLAIRDLKALGCHDVKLLEPTDEVVRAMLRNGITPSFRTYMQSDVISWDKVHIQLEQIRRLRIEGPIVQWFCEANNPESELSDKDHPITPERHVEEVFIPVADYAAKYGVRSVLTPPDHMKTNEKDFFFRQLKQLVKGRDLEWVRTHVLVGAHSYTGGPEDTPFKRLGELNELIVKAVGHKNHGMGIVISEIGRHRNRIVQISEQDFARDTVAIGKWPIPQDLNIVKVYGWILANFAQRPAGDRRDSGIVQDFELQAWRGVEGAKPVFEAWKRFYNEELLPRKK